MFLTMATRSQENQTQELSKIQPYNVCNGQQYLPTIKCFNQDFKTAVNKLQFILINDFNLKNPLLSA